MLFLLFKSCFELFVDVGFDELSGFEICQM
jgi:hypothetical protein